MNRHIYRLIRLLVLALLLALVLCLLTPRTSKAYAFLLRSEPSSNTVLKTEPVQVRLWFSEALNADGSTGRVVNAANQRVDVNGALVLPTDMREMDIALRPDLQPGIYVVIWHTQSASNGQIFSGAFPFSIADASGAVPAPNKPLPDQSQFAPGMNAQIDSVTIFRWLMAALVYLSAIFWVSGKIWHSFVLDPTELEIDQQREVAHQSRQRFAQQFSLPVLRILFLASIGTLIGQALTITAGRWDLLLSPTLLVSLLTDGSSGLFWLASEVVIALAIMLETMLLFSQRHTPNTTSNDSSAWLDLTVGLLILITIMLTSYTTASIMPTVLTMLVGALYLLAATLWLGGQLYIVLIYLPVLHDRPANERPHLLQITLQRFSPLIISAAIIMLLSGTYNIIVRRSLFNQFHTTLYEPVLLVQSICTITLFVAGAWQIFLLLPALSKDNEGTSSTASLSSSLSPSLYPEKTALARPYIPAESTHRLSDYTPANPDNGHAKAVPSEAALKTPEQHSMPNVNRLTILLHCTLLLSVIAILCMALTSVLVGSF